MRRLCITAFLVLIISCTSLFVHNASAQTSIFGNSAVGSLTNYFDTAKDASRFQLAQNGQMQSITAYFANTGFNAKAAIYTDNNGAPSTLITQSNSQTITTSGWQTFTVPQTSLTAGYYWLCVVSSSASSTGKMTATSTNTHAWKTTTYSSEYASTFGAPSGYETTATSIYATYTPTTTTTTQSSIFSQGIVTPTTILNGNNLIPISDSQWYTDINWNAAPADGILLSSSVTHNGNPSWFIPLTSNCFGVDRCVNISPGDHIVFSCWIKTSGATVSADYNNPQAGGRIGIDFYGSLGGISASSVPDGTTSTTSNPYGSNTDTYNTYVPFGSNGHDWKQVTMDFIVPSQIQYLYGITGQTGHYSIGQMVTPTWCIVWLQVWSDTQGFSEQGTAWFAEPTFYINP